MSEEVVRRACELMPAWRPEEVRVLTFLDGGYSNHNYRIEHRKKSFVLRLPQHTQPYVDRHHEANFYADLESGLGLKPAAIDTASGRMLTPWIEGTLLVDAWSSDADAPCVDDLVNYLRTLHRKLPPARRGYDPALLIAHYFAASDLPTPSLPQSAPASGTLQTCHNDLNPWNILLLADGSWLTLDWEFVGYNDALFDAMSLHQGLALDMAPEDFAARYLDRATAEVRDATRQALILFWWREFAWATYQRYVGNTRDEIAQQQTTARTRLRQLGEQVDYPL